MLCIYPFDNIMIGFNLIKACFAFTLLKSSGWSQLVLYYHVKMTHAVMMRHIVFLSQNLAGPAMITNRDSKTQMPSQHPTYMLLDI